VPGQQVAEYLLQQPDLGGEPGGQLPQRGDLARVRLRQGELIEPGLPCTPKMSVWVTGTPSLASTPCTWSLYEVRALTSLCR
jgi:hypothetical protein